MRISPTCDLTQATAPTKATCRTLPGSREGCVAWLRGPAMLNKDGVALRDKRGKIKYAHCFVFDSREIRDAFSAAVIRALLEFAPTVFEDT